MNMTDIEVALRGAMQHIGMEVPADKFAELRYSVAKALQEMGAIENHPVLRI